MIQSIKSTICASPQRKILFGLAGSFTTLGFYRGCQEFKYVQLKNRAPTFEDYFCLSMHGLISATLYANPLIGFFALYHEISRARMLVNGSYNEMDYYTNPFFSVVQTNSSSDPTIPHNEGV